MPPAMAHADSSHASPSAAAPRTRSSPSRLPPKLEETESKSNLFVETVSSFRDVASDTITGIKEWATATPSPQCHNISMAETVDDMKEWYSPRRSDNSNHTSRSASGRTTSSARPESSSRGSGKSSTRTSLVHDLVSPFLVCGGLADHYQRPSSSRSKSHPFKNHARSSSWNPIFVSLEGRTESGGSEYTMDTRAEEEILQLNRMTSWGTIGTLGTAATFDTVQTNGTLDTNEGGGDVETNIAVQDDDGNVIPPVLLEKAQKRLEQRKARRKRVVKFDYPPISSLRECPRANPEDLPGLFFTEEELEQIEGDRCSTITADDVEIVAIASPKSQDTVDEDDWDNRMHNQSSKSVSTEHSTQSIPPSASFSKYNSTPTLHRKQQRPHSPHPGRPVASANYSVDGRDPPDLMNKQKQQSKPPKKADIKLKAKSPRLIRGVQIYLRERSTGAGV